MSNNFKRRVFAGIMVVLFSATWFTSKSTGKGISLKKSGIDPQLAEDNLDPRSETEDYILPGESDTKENPSKRLHLGHRKIIRRVPNNN